MAIKEVGILLKVAASGLENISLLTRELNNAGVQTSAFDRQAAELSGELKRLGQEQALIDQFKRQKAAVAEAAAAMEAAKSEAGALARALASTEAPSRAQEAAFNKARTAARQVDQAYQDQRLALQGLRTQMAGAGISTGELAAAQVRVRQEALQTRTALEQLEGQYRAAAQVAAQTATTQVQSSGQVREGLSEVGRQLGAVRNLAAAAIGGQIFSGLIGDVAKTSEAYANLAARIELVTGKGPQLKSSFDGVFEVALRTNTAVEATGNLFARVAEAGKKLGVSQADALRLTETINQAVQVSGASAEASNAAITQLVQSLQSGVLRGDEFNSIMEQAPRLSKALADGLGIGTGELRKMAEQGALTSQTVIGALQGQSVAVAREFELLPATVGRSLQNLSTSWTRYVGEVDKANGVSSAAAHAIDLLSGNLASVGAALVEAGKAAVAWAAFKLADSFSAQASAAKMAAQAVTLESQAVLAGTVATGQNTVAKRANEAAWLALAQAMRTSSDADLADTRALALNTEATVANASAKRAAASSAGSSAGALVNVGKAGIDAAAGLTAGTQAAQASTGVLGRLGSAATGAIGILGRIAGTVAIASLAWDGLKAAGTWIGESAAKLAGYRDRTDEMAAAAQRAARDAELQHAQMKQLAQQTALAAEKALGMTDASRKLVADFDDLRTKGESAGAALEKLAKDLDLGSVSGINDAVTALDVLERKGKITGDQVRQSLVQALDGKDLAIFETNARAAFDGSEQGARRLKAVLDAVADESLKRVGTSVGELQTGFSKAMVSAMNDTDALAKTLVDLGIKSDQAGALLGKSLDKEVEAATTEKALLRVKERVIELRRENKITADQSAAQIDNIEKKLDGLKPSIDSVGEAARRLGIQTKAELSKTADEFKASWDKIANSTTVSLEEKIKGFVKYRAAAMAANNGVESSEVALQRQTLETQAATAGLGAEFEKAMGKAGTAVNQAKVAVNELGEQVNAAGERVNQLAGGFNQVSIATKRAEDAALRYGSTLKQATYDAERFALAADGSRLAGSAGDGTVAGTVTPEGIAALEKSASDAQTAYSKMLANALAGKAVNGAQIITTGVSPAFVELQRQTVSKEVSRLEAIAKQAAADLAAARDQANGIVYDEATGAKVQRKAVGTKYDPTTGKPITQWAGPAAAGPSAAPSSSNQTYTVNLNLTDSSGQSTGGQVNVASPQDASTLVAFLQQLQLASSRAGGP